MGLGLRVETLCLRGADSCDAPIDDSDVDCTGEIVLSINTDGWLPSGVVANGDLGEEAPELVVTRRNAGPLEGDLDSEWRRFSRVEAESMRWTCVGEGT